MWWSTWRMPNQRVTKRWLHFKLQRRESKVRQNNYELHSRSCNQTDPRWLFLFQLAKRKQRIHSLPVLEPDRERRPSLRVSGPLGVLQFNIRWRKRPCIYLRRCRHAIEILEWVECTVCPTQPECHKYCMDQHQRGACEQRLPDRNSQDNFQGILECSVKSLPRVRRSCVELRNAVQNPRVNFYGLHAARYNQRNRNNSFQTRDGSLARTAAVLV